METTDQQGHTNQPITGTRAPTQPTTRPIALVTPETPQVTSNTPEPPDRYASPTSLSPVSRRSLADQLAANQRTSLYTIVEKRVRIDTPFPLTPDIFRTGRIVTRVMTPAAMRRSTSSSSTPPLSDRSESPSRTDNDYGGGYVRAQCMET